MASTAPQVVTVSDLLGSDARSAFKAPTLLQQKKGKRWTIDEDNLLRTAIQTLGEKRWRKIADQVPGRTSVQCLHRWTKILRPGLVKGPWTPQEDELLKDWVNAHGPNAWAKCAQVITGRNGKQCRERWNNALDPGLTRGNWTYEEDIQIFDLYYREGPKWSLIASLMAGRYGLLRSENSIKNRFYSNVRKMINHKKKGQTHMAEEGKPLGRHDVPCDYDEHIRRKTIASIGNVLKMYSLEELKTIFTEVKQEQPQDHSGIVVPVPRYGSFLP